MLESIVSQIPVIGSILGPLIKTLFSSENQQRVRYAIRMGNDTQGEVCFLLNEENNHVELLNLTRNPVIVSFPAQNSYTGETLTLYKGACADMNQPFYDCTTNDIQSFEITTSLGGAKHAPNGESLLTVSSSGTVSTDGSKKKLGSFIYAQIELINNPSTLEDESWLNITMDTTCTFCRLVNLFVESAEGNQEYQISNCEPVSDRVRVLLPPLCVKGAALLVSVTVECTQNAKRMLENNRKYNIRQLMPEQIAKALSLPNVNR